MLTTVFTAIPVVIGAVLLLAAGWEFMTWRTRFANWREGTATSLGAAKVTGDVGPHLAFRYVIDGATFEGRSSYMKDDVPKEGETVRIYYDPANPTQSEWYDAGMHRFFMFGVGLLGLFLIWLAVIA